MISKPIAFSIDNAYAPYLYVCLKSVLAHIQPENKYQAYVLESGLSEEHKRQILSLQCDNLSIEFIDVRKFIDKNVTRAFAVTEHFTPETYYRFFLPQIFPNLDKVLYLDADSLIMRDISPLFEINIEENYLGVTHDCEIVRMSNLDDTEYSDYFTKTLGVKIENYFQAGVMLVNLTQMRQDSITEKLLSALIKIGTPKFVDQDILNMVCQNKVKFIPQNWDYTWHLSFWDNKYLEHIGDPLNKEYEKARLNPYIIHFTGNHTKPTDFPNVPEAQKFWEYAKNSPYYDRLILCMSQNREKHLKKIRRIKLKILEYKLLNILMLGLYSKKYKNKIQKRENDLSFLVKRILLI